jgi:hypothetical protein
MEPPRRVLCDNLAPQGSQAMEAMPESKSTHVLYGVHSQQSFWEW